MRVSVAHLFSFVAPSTYVTMRHSLCGAGRLAIRGGCWLRGWKILMTVGSSGIATLDRAFVYRPALSKYCTNNFFLPNSISSTPGSPLVAGPTLGWRTTGKPGIGAKMRLSPAFVAPHQMHQRRPPTAVIVLPLVLVLSSAARTNDKSLA